MHASPRSPEPRDRARAGGADAGPIGYGRQYVDQDDVDAVAAVLLGDSLTQGPAVPRFEAGLVQATGAPHAVAVANGTCALHLAYHVLGVGPGRDVLTTANTFLATATAAQMCGGEAEFVDVDPRTGNLDVRLLEERLARGSVPHVVTAVHFAGLPCDMEWLIALKRRHDFLLVEDAAHALGARYRVEGAWYRPGEHPEVDATVLSFHPVKHVTTGEGGAVLVHDAERAKRLRRLRSHGVDPDGALDLAPYLRMTAGEFQPDGRQTPFKPQIELGFNYRLSDVQAALGTSQLAKLPDFLAARREVALRYLAELRGYGLPHPGGLDAGADREHAWHLFVIRCEPGERDELMRSLRQLGIHTQVHYYPVPLQPWFRERAVGGPFPHAIEHARTALSLPIYPALSEEDQARVIAALHAHARARTVA
jgi:dTDP-4-amino-4,6-dideoxygalactose transaminase